MESHILSESAAYFDWNFLHVNLEERPKIERTRDNLFFDLRSNFSIVFRCLCRLIRVCIVSM